MPAPMLSPLRARMTPMPRGWDGSCTLWFDRLPSWNGWVYMSPACRLHDWHYAILRANHGHWTDEEHAEFRLWADELFHDALLYVLQDTYVPRTAAFIARWMHRAVRRFGAKHAMGVL